MLPKDWWKSKLIWTGLVTSLAGLLLPVEMREHVVFVVLGILTMIFRWTTTTTIK